MKHPGEEFLTPHGVLWYTVSRYSTVLRRQRMTQSGYRHQSGNSLRLWHTDQSRPRLRSSLPFLSPLLDELSSKFTRPFRVFVESRIQLPFLTAPVSDFLFSWIGQQRNQAVIQGMSRANSDKFSPDPPTSQHGISNDIDDFMI